MKRAIIRFMEMGMETFVAKEDMEEKRICVQMSERDLLCKNNCGFYGTPQCQGFCSMCWRTYQQEQKYTKNKVLLGQESVEEKRKVSDNRPSTIRSLLPKSPSLLFSSAIADVQGLPSASNSSFGLKSLGADNPAAQKDFFKYLDETFAPGVARDMERHCMGFMDKLAKTWSVCKETDARRDETISDMIQLFYRSMTEKISRLKNLSEDFKASDFMTKLESYICDHAYSILFCTRSEEEEADLKLQERIRSLHWVTFGFLETSLDFSSTKVQDYLDEAVTQIVDMNSHRQANMKLECLMNCSKFIFDALKESRSGAPASADEFLPVLIYAILKANPPLIQSNMNFITKFSLPYRIMRGESGYYFTNLSCALQFIKNMNAESLHLSDEDFDAYTNGRKVAPKRNSVSSSVVKSLENSLKRVDDIIERRAALTKSADELEEKIERDSAQLKQSVDEFVEEVACEETVRLHVEISEDTRN